MQTDELQAATPQEAKLDTRFNEVKIPYETETTPSFPCFVLFFAILFFCGSIAAAVWVPVSCMKSFVPVQEAQIKFMQNQAKALYWQQSAENLRRYLAPSRFAEHLPSEFTADYGELYRKYRQEMRDQYEKFDEKNPELQNEAYTAHGNLAVHYERIVIYPEKNNFLTRFMKTPYKTRLYYVLWGLTVASLLSGYCLFRLRQSNKKSTLFLVSLVALLSSGTLAVLPFFYCWLDAAISGFNANPDFIGNLGDLWGFFMLLGTVGYLCSAILIFMVFFVPKSKTVFRRTRVFLALILILLPGLLGGPGCYLINQARVDLQVHYTYAMLQIEEMPALKEVYQRFDEDYQLLLEKHEIKLPLSSAALADNNYSYLSFPQEQPSVSYTLLAAMLKRPSTGLISMGNLENWGPPQRYMTWSRTMGELFVFAMTFLFGSPGLVYAVAHVVQLKHET